MVWVMKKQIKGKNYLYLYKTKWVNGKPKSVFIKYLGSANNLTDANIKKAKEEAEDTQHG